MFKRFLFLSAAVVVLLAGAANARGETIYFAGPAEPLGSGPGSFTVQVDGELFDRIWKLTVGVSVEQPAGWPNTSFRITDATPLGPFAAATCVIENPSKEPSRVTMQLPSVHGYTTATFLPRQPILRITFSYPEDAFGVFSLKSTAGVTQAVRVVIGVPGTVPVDGVPGAFRIDDTEAPRPTPMRWAAAPYPAPGALAVTMLATTAADTQNDVEYYFEETSGNPGGEDSGWQDSPAYTDTGVMPLTAYAYRVKARDKSPNRNETEWSATEPVTTPADTFPPEPNPPTWQTVPQALSDQLGITMAVSPADDVSGVEYYFEETSGNPGGDDSGWQDSPAYIDMGLMPQTAYTYRVKARDKSVNRNETDWASEQSATSVPDIFPPLPNPPVWAIAPTADGFAITMTCQTLEDASGVEYCFEETSGNPGGDDSGWQDSPTYTDTGLKPGTTYTYRVKARDKMPVANEGLASEEASATTRSPNDAVPMLISYQGRLDRAGKPLTASAQMTFSFCTSAEGGEALYSELQTVQVANGIFNVLIGSVEPLTKDVFDQPVLYLGVKVADDAEMAPRKRVASAPFAIKAESAGTAALAYWSETSDRAEEAMDQIADLQQQVAALQALLAGVTRDGNTITCSGVNVQIVNGTGTTAGPPNGLGNLIVGYNELRGGGDNRTGSHNIVTGQGNNYASYGGLVAGSNNTISGPFASVSGGYGNTASGACSAASGGRGNTASWESSSVSGGLNNLSGGYCSSVSGGWQNAASGQYSSVSGGRGSTAAADSSSVSGGVYNLAGGLYASVGGGQENTAGGEKSSVGGGWENAASGQYSSVSGGQGSTAAAESSSVSGGLYNLAAGSHSSVTGGRSNTASGHRSSVSGGRYNTASGEYSCVLGGGGPDSTDGNAAFSNYTAILGGQRNLAGDASLASQSVGQWSTISGGRNNVASGECSSVSGGGINTASGECSSVSGGNRNAASGQYSSISAGQWNAAQGWYSSITGGNHNTVQGTSRSISGGQNMTIDLLDSVLWRVGNLWVGYNDWPICTELEVVGAGGAP